MSRRFRSALYLHVEDVPEYAAAPDDVRAAVDAEGIPTEPVAVPVDVQAAAAVAWGGAGGACGNLAAEDGRGSRQGMAAPFAFVGALAARRSRRTS